MDTPDYLSALPEVAKLHGSFTHMKLLGDQLRRQWSDLEAAAAKVPSRYDLFIRSNEDYYGLHSALGYMASALYHIPGASYEKDIETLRAKDAEYGGSWCRRGGQGAFFMLARKWDRIDKALAAYQDDLGLLLEGDRRQEGVLDDLKDLRCYLLLVLSWHSALNAMDHPF